jgi:LacI family transcriptional regulator
MREVAALAGVSVQTVSNHVNGRHQFMSAETSRRVADAMRELGYHRNLTARGLRSAKTLTLGFLVLDEHARFLADPLTDLIMAGIGDVAREHDYGVLIKSSKPSEDPDRLLAPVLESRVDGAFLLLSGERSVRQEQIARMSQLTDRFVVFDEPVDDPKLMSVRAADREGGRAVTDHLIERGHRRIAFVGAAVPWAVVEQRLLGFNEAHESAGMAADPELVMLEAGWEPESAVPIAERLLRRPDPPTAVVCATDLLALATVHTARRLGRDVPGDVAISGFDDFQFSQFARPSLTTVRLPAYDMGREAARILIERLRGGGEVAGGHQIELPVELLVREST